MKTIIFFALFSLAASSLFAGDFTRETAFESTEVFAAAAKVFQPANSDSDLSKIFTIIEEPGVTPPATADSIDSADVIWESHSQAIAFVLAQPPTRYTICKIGVLFYLIQDHGKWHISDVHSFDAYNREADVKCEVTSGEQTDTIVTITVTCGRRSWTSKMSASYSPSGNKLKRLDPEKD